MKDFIAGIIATGNYVLSEMEERIDRMYVCGKLTVEERDYLQAYAAERANDTLQIDVAAIDVNVRIKAQCVATLGWEHHRLALCHELGSAFAKHVEHVLNHLLGDEGVVKVHVVSHEAAVNCLDHLVGCYGLAFLSEGFHSVVD